MIFLRCERCAATTWAKMDCESDVNAVSIEPPAAAAWDAHEPQEPLDHSVDCTCGSADCPGVYMKYNSCQHEDYEILEEDE